MPNLIYLALGSSEIELKREFKLNQICGVSFRRIVMRILNGRRKHLMNCYKNEITLSKKKKFH